MSNQINNKDQSSFNETKKILEGEKGYEKGLARKIQWHEKTKTKTKT